MRVVCIDNSGEDLTLNKCYEVLEYITERKITIIINDDGYKYGYYSRRFISLSKLRKYKINKINGRKRKIY